MKIPLNYGLLTTLAIIAWVIVSHLVVPNPQSKIHSLGAVTFFNLAHFAYLDRGIKALEREKGDKPIFKEGLKTGISISLVYAISAALFFVGVLVFVGPDWIASEPTAAVLPTWLVALQAFAGLGLGAMVFGVIYSTLISFVLAKRLSSDR